MEVGGSKAGVTLMNCRSDRCLYQEGEKVLASYGGRWYEAKVCIYIHVCMDIQIHTCHTIFFAI